MQTGSPGATQAARQQRVAPELRQVAREAGSAFTRTARPFARGATELFLRVHMAWRLQGEKGLRPLSERRPRCNESPRIPHIRVKLMDWLDAAPLLVLGGAVVAAVLGALELGHRLGLHAPASEHQTSKVAAPILAMAGLLLAFSFSMAADRQSLRRSAAVQEANSIGTFWLRTSLLPEPTRSAMRSRVRRYVDLHLEHRQARIQEAKTDALEVEAGRLQAELWALLIEDVRLQPEASRSRLVVPALNAMLDDAAGVLAARENRLPDAIVAYLFLLVVLAGVAAGYGPRGETRSPILWALFAIVVGGVMVVLLDVNRPRRGLIQTDMGPYLRLRESMEVDPP